MSIQKQTELFIIQFSTYSCPIRVVILFKKRTVQNEMKKYVPFPLRSFSSSPRRLLSAFRSDPKYKAKTVHVIVITL